MDESTEWLLMGVGELLLLVIYMLLFYGLKPTTDKSGLMKLWRHLLQSAAKPFLFEAPKCGDIAKAVSVLTLASWTLWSLDQARFRHEKPQQLQALKPA